MVWGLLSTKSIRILSRIRLLILGILNDGMAFYDINNTDLVFIMKNKNPSTPLDFRPISLCNVVYKIMSKVLVNRLKPVSDHAWCFCS